MILGSHNSWSFRKPKKWWQRPFAFIGRCQRKNIRQQYEAGVRCFDLRIRPEYDAHAVAHGIFEYCELFDVLGDLAFLNEKQAYVRVIHEARKEKEYNDISINLFRLDCMDLERYFPEIKFWCGRNLFNWDVDYKFKYNPSCEENYSSVRKPRVIDDWWPWLYAKTHNRKILKKGTDKDILLIDFVDMS